MSALDPDSEWPFPHLLGFDGALDTLPQIMAPGHIEYFKLKQFEKMAEAEIHRFHYFFESSFTYEGPRSIKN